jgi:hypothetical protein
MGKGESNKYGMPKPIKEAGDVEGINDMLRLLFLSKASRQMVVLEEATKEQIKSQIKNREAVINIVNEKAYFTINIEGEIYETELIKKI